MLGNHEVPLDGAQKALRLARSLLRRLRKKLRLLCERILLFLNKLLLVVVVPCVAVRGAHQFVGLCVERVRLLVQLFVVGDELVHAL